MIVLSVLIPTRNRTADVLFLLSQIRHCITKNKPSDNFEIVISDNSDNNDSYEKCKPFSDIGVKYFKHEKIWPTAEESVFNSVKFCSGKYIWILGDDDYIKDNSIEYLINILKSSDESFFLLNCDVLNLENKIVEYLPSNKNGIVKYDNGVDFFSEFGIISATTTMSCLVIKKDIIDIKVFNLLSSISPIYSHSTSLFCFLYDKKCGFIKRILLTYRLNDMTKEQQSLANAYDESCFDNHGQTIGILKLISEASRITSIPIKKILQFNEPQLSKITFDLVNQKLWVFIILGVLQTILENFSTPNENKSKLVKLYSKTALKYLSHIDKKHGKRISKILKKQGSIFGHDFYVNKIRKERFYLSNLKD